MAAKCQRGRHPNSRRNLRSTQPGDVLNPKGNNQHTYRVAWENQIQQILDEHHDEFPGNTKREVLARVLIDCAMRGKPLATQLVMKRLWPERSPIEVTGSLESDRKADLSKLADEELETLEELMDKALDNFD
jgi:hypothetical protein